MSQMTDIHRQLRQDILDLAVSPGERFSERSLEARFTASRTPIRGALLQLQSEDLVRREGRGWIVAPIDLGEIQSLMEYREPLEAAAARLACERATDLELDALDALLEAGQDGAGHDESHRIGADFHIEMARLSANPFLLKSIQEVMTRLSRPRWLEVRTDAARDQAWQEHRHLLALVRARQAEPAAQAAVDHVRQTRDRLLLSLRDDRRALRARGFAIVGQHHG